MAKVETKNTPMTPTVKAYLIFKKCVSPLGPLEKRKWEGSGGQEKVEAQYGSVF